MKLYHFDRATGAFTGEVSDADPDPLELDLARRAVSGPLMEAATVARDQAVGEAYATLSAQRALLTAAEQAVAALAAQRPLESSPFGQPEPKAVPPLAEDADEDAVERHAAAVEAYAVAVEDYEAARAAHAEKLAAEADVRAAYDQQVNEAATELATAKEDMQIAQREHSEAVAAATSAFDAATLAAAEAASAVAPPRWLLPAFATFDAPPTPGAGERARWSEEAWLLEPIPVAPPAPPLSDVELRHRAAVEIHARIAALRPTIDQYRDELDLGRPTTLSAAGYTSLLEHVQALREVPTQPGFPAEIDWPALPAGGV